MKILANIEKMRMWSLWVAFLGMTLVSCENILEEEVVDCSVEYRVKFKYDHNMKFADAFANEVRSVTLYAFDQDGKFVYQRTEQGDILGEDGYTMPIVCYKLTDEDKYIIVDGFHRYRIMLEYPDIYKREGGRLPVSVIDKPIDYRMASTIRHNRARGSHDVDLMSNIVKELHELGRSDAWISKHLGMDRDEILRLKQITGLAALFRDVDFGEAWIPDEEVNEGESI